MGASIPALRVLLTDFKQFTQRRLSDQSESQGSNFDFWDDNSRQSRRSLFKWDIFGSSKSVEPSNAITTTSNVSCRDTVDFAPPAGLAAHLWRSDSTESPPVCNFETVGTSRTEGSGSLTPETSISRPVPTHPAPSHNYPNLSQQLEDFLWSRKNSYAGPLSESIYDGDIRPVVNTVSKKNYNGRAIKQRFLGPKSQFTSALKPARKDDSDRDTWSLSNVIEHGESGKGPLVVHSGTAGQFVVIQTTEITVDFE